MNARANDEVVYMFGERHSPISLKVFQLLCLRYAAAFPPSRKSSLIKVNQKSTYFVPLVDIYLTFPNIGTKLDQKKGSYAG